MGRKILGVVVGYVVSFIWVMVTLSLLWTALGAGFAFEGDTTDTSIGWTLSMVVLGFIGAVLSGWVAAAIGKSPKAATWLAVLILLIGLALAICYTLVDRQAMAEEALAGRSPAELSMMEAASAAVPPAWYDWVIPLAGALGAVLGGRIWARRAAGP